MAITISHKNGGNTLDKLIIIDDVALINTLNLSADNLAFAHTQFQLNLKSVSLFQNSNYFFILKLESKNTAAETDEANRKLGCSMVAIINSFKIATIQIENKSKTELASISIAEGIALGNYQFLNYYKDPSKKLNTLKKIEISGSTALVKEINTLSAVCEALYQVRDWVNTPVLDLNAVQWGKVAQAMAKKYKFKAEVWDKKKIIAKKMGGLLAVNLGSAIAPTFTILEHKPAKPINKKPIVLVGKGVMYDTGGLSIKPTPDSMDHMKCDMSGAAAVLGAFIATALTNLPIHVIGLMPATDNRINGKEYAPGDVIKMHNGLFVEVLNTDAEGRMILADALSFADSYKPELIVDIATLTGAAARAIGPWGHAVMGNAPDSVLQEFVTAGEMVNERAVIMPFWEEYGEKMKSSIADLKNVGGADAGAMTAGKFLEFFTQSPYVHNDIAGPAFSNTPMSYRGFGGTGYGMRYLYQFLLNRTKK
jgi:leucyl aminopeptidase